MYFKKYAERESQQLHVLRKIKSIGSEGHEMMYFFYLTIRALLLCCITDWRNATATYLIKINSSQRKVEQFFLSSVSGPLELIFWSRATIYSDIENSRSQLWSDSPPKVTIYAPKRLRQCYFYWMRKSKTVFNRVFLRRPLVIKK